MYRGLFWIFEVWRIYDFAKFTNLCVADVEIFYSYANLHLKASKSDPFRKRVTIQLHISNHNICPFSAIKKYLAVRRCREAPFCLSDPLFIKEDGCASDWNIFLTFVDTTRIFFWHLWIKLESLQRTLFSHWCQYFSRIC